ncbi:Zinc transporter ZIP10 [Acropora cervicornis]|uniref:Zinc transporter ZIP10 n=1 Tax=Acropora cervicornis TaxID=6130 RepID=A0AAD9QZL2_ACRCE|nr:Zinc transporter ZIP10 [Acropora cervicornis]
MTPLITNGILLSMLSLFMLVSSHDSRKHEHYTFKDLREAVDGDSLSYEDQQRLFDRLKFWNCTKPKPTSDDRKCFTLKDLHSFDGRSTPKALNVTEFQELSPVILFCLLPARELNSSNTSCNVYPKNHSELFIEFAKNFNQGKHGITIEALDRILEAINQTIGEFLVKKKCFSAKSIFNEVKDEEHEEEEHGHAHEEHGHMHEEHGHAHEEHGHAHEEHHGAEEKSLDQHDFEKASASIIFHLVQGFCIEEGHAHNGTESKLPSKEFFLKEIFGNKTHLLEDDLEKITKALKIGEPLTTSSSSDEHSDHDHGHRLWGYGIATVTVISLTSLVGVATLPLFGKKVYKKILALLVALAVGTLSGDALLHLLPHEGIKTFNRSPSCLFHSHCVYEHVCAKDTEEIELFET